MERMRLIIIFSTLLMFSTSSLGGGHDDELIYAKLLDDKYACENSLPILVVAPDAIESHDFMSALFFLKEGDRHLQNSLRYLEGEGGFFFCLDERSLQYASLVLNYGYDQCKGFIYSFRVESFNNLLAKKKVFIKSPQNYLAGDQSKAVSKCGK